MSFRPGLALLIPAYNAAAHLPRLLDSAARQTEPFDETWVYDDASTDDTAAIAERYGARLLRGEVNRGCSHGKNRLAAETACGWIHFHDADDELLPNFVERARPWMEEGSSDVVFFAYEEREEPTGRRLGFGRFDPVALRTDPKGYAIRHKVTNFALYRRQAFLDAGGFDEDPLVLYAEDGAFHIRLAFHGLSFAADETVVSINHRRQASMSMSHPLRCLQSQYYMLRKTAGLRGAEPYAGDIARKLWIAVGGLAAHLDWRTADQAALLAARLGGASDIPAGRLFKGLCQASPRLAIRVREWAIRSLKPVLRQGYPGWKAQLRG